MSQQTINVGLDPNDGTGDSLRVAGFKINQNFSELYAATSSGINSISSGEGIDVADSFGQVTITNLYPNRGTFKRIAVAGQTTLEADQLEDTLTLVAGSNVTLTTDANTDTLTISVNTLDIGELEGDFTGTFNGTASGTFNGTVESTDIDSTLLKISGNPGIALQYYQALVDQQTILLNDISDLNDELQQSQLDLENLQDDLAILQAQPSPDPAAVLALQNAIASKQLEINGIQTEISQKQVSLSSIETEIDIIEPTLSFPYVGLTYNTQTLKWSATRHLVVPALTVGDMQFPTTDGNYGEVLTTNGDGTVFWLSILGNLSVNNTTIRPNVDGEIVRLSAYESGANQLDGYVELKYVPATGSSPAVLDSSLIVGASGVVAYVKDQQVEHRDQGINFNYKQGISYGQDSVVAALGTSVIYTSVDYLNSMTIKLVLQAECIQGSQNEVQAAEMIVIKNDNNTVASSVYGVIYTGSSAIATYNSQYNSVTGKIEVTATNLSGTHAANIRAHAVEIGKTD